MSNINVDTIKNRSGSGAPGFPNGLTVTGVATATTFSGNLTGNVTGTASVATLATNAQNLTGSPSITVGAINNTGISTISDLRLASVSDKVTVVTGTGVTLAYNSGGGNVAKHWETGRIDLVTGDSNNIVHYFNKAFVSAPIGIENLKVYRYGEFSPSQYGVTDVLFYFIDHASVYFNCSVLQAPRQQEKSFCELS